MLIETKEKGIELLYRSIPYSNQIMNIDLSKENSIYFDWRSARYKLELYNCSVWTVSNIMLEGSDRAILMEHCLKLNLISNL